MRNKRITCQQCKSLIEYDPTSTHEGLRDFEEIVCPRCDYVVTRVFTDLIPSVRVVDQQNRSGDIRFLLMFSYLFLLKFKIKSKIAIFVKK